MAKDLFAGNVKHPVFKLPSYRLHKASGQAVVTVRGRDIYLSTLNAAGSMLCRRRCATSTMFMACERSRDRYGTAQKSPDFGMEVADPVRDHHSRRPNEHACDSAGLSGDGLWSDSLGFLRPLALCYNRKLSKF